MKVDTRHVLVIAALLWWWLGWAVAVAVLSAWIVLATTLLRHLTSRRRVKTEREWIEGIAEARDSGRPFRCAITATTRSLNVWAMHPWPRPPLRHGESLAMEPRHLTLQRRRPSFAQWMAGQKQETRRIIRAWASEDPGTRWPLLRGMERR